MHRIRKSILIRWLSLRITEKFAIILSLLILIGVFEAAISVTAMAIVRDAAGAARSSLEVQRLSLEMSRDWEAMKNNQYRFFALYREIGVVQAKERYAIPAGEQLSEIVRVGADLKQMVTGPDASDNYRSHDVMLQQYISALNAYALGLESAVGLAVDGGSRSEEHIAESLNELEALAWMIEPNFTQLTLMAQIEVADVHQQIAQTQRRVTIFLILANVLGFALIGLVIYGFNKNISTHVARLTHATERMQAGHLQERVRVHSADEFGQIGAAFNSMAEAIQHRTDALSESEARYRELVSAAPYFVFVLQSGRLVFANNACLNALQYTWEGLAGAPFLNLVHMEDRSLLEGWVHSPVDTEESEAVEVRLLNSNGSILILDMVAVPIMFDRQPAVLGVGHDITERRKMEAAIIESEKMAGIGTLAAGIAHEINSPLQVITGYSGSLHRDIKENKQEPIPNLENRVESIERNAWRIAAIIQSLLAYARPPASLAGRHVLNEIVEETLLLIEHRLKSWSNVVIKKELAPDIPAMVCDRNRITQMLINLLNNAADAMPLGGAIIIRTGFDENNRQFNLQVSDTGIGIPEEMQARIFEPFFTTKDVGKGTGLGLSIVRSIVEAHGGSIQLVSAEGKGAVFTIVLPQQPPDYPAATSTRLKMGRYGR